MLYKDTVSLRRKRFTASTALDAVPSGCVHWYITEICLPTVYGLSSLNDFERNASRASRDREVKCTQTERMNCTG